MSELLTVSARELARRIRGREVSSCEVVRTHIERVAAVNPTINAVVAERFDAALREAAAADRTLARGADVGPLHGVPFTAKEVFALTGMPQTGGLVARKDHIATQDATAIARLRAAGAIPLGVTNTSELAMWLETNNRLYGRTKNPHDPKRIAGGSSGGEGAIVAAGGSPFGLAADFAGSIRLPAFFNGVFGHKPTGGLVPSTGQFPQATGAAARYQTTGPITRRAEDLMPLLKILAGPDGLDTSCRPCEIGDPEAVVLDRLQILLIEDNGTHAVHAELKQACRRAAHALGGSLRTLELPLLKKSFAIWSSAVVSAQGESFRSLLGYSSNTPLFIEFLKWIFDRSQHTFPALGLATLETGMKQRKHDRCLRMAGELKDQLQKELGANGILIYPSYTQTAPPHSVPIFSRFNWVYTAIFNVLELPVTQVPMGLSFNGLPLGVQIAAGIGKDHLTIAAALELEKQFGGSCLVLDSLDPSAHSFANAAS